MQLDDLSDDELIASLRAVCAERRHLDVRLVLHLSEVEARSLHLKAACSSMYDFCVDKLGLSVGAAHRRINAARLVRRFPSLAGRLERGEVHLSGLAVLAKHLTEETFEGLMAAVVGKSQLQIESFLASYAPKPDVPGRISPLAPREQQQQPALTLGTSSPSSAPVPRARRIEPLSDDRFRVEFTASRELRDKLERARELMRHRNPDGDVSAVFECAIDVLLAKLEKERLGKTSRPRRVVREAKRGTIARAVRRAVFERDGEQCTFESGDGSRCPSRGFLELDHIVARAKGGPDDASNLRVRCRAHNRLHAEEVFGREYIARRIDFQRRKLNRARSANEPDGGPTARPVDLALRGLVNMGFAKSAAQRALDELTHRNESAALPVADLLRQAIRALT